MAGNRTGTMDRFDVEHGGVLAMVGGALFVPYAILKGPVTTAIVDTGTHLPGTSARLTAQLFHVGEAIPLLLVAAGFHGIVELTRETRTRAGALGSTLTVVGFGMVLCFHVAEHVTTPGSGLLPAGVAASFEWGYYAGWLVLLAGMALVGVGIRRSDALPRWVSWMLAVALPVGVGVGLAVVALDVYTYAGTQRLVVGLAWTAIGSRLWWRRCEHDGRQAPAAR